MPGGATWRSTRSANLRITSAPSRVRACEIADCWLASPPDRPGPAKCSPFADHAQLLFQGRLTPQRQCDHAVHDHWRRQQSLALAGSACLSQHLFAQRPWAHTGQHPALIKCARSIFLRQRVSCSRHRSSIQYLDGLELSMKTIYLNTIAPSQRDEGAADHPARAGPSDGLLRSHAGGAGRWQGSTRSRRRTGRCAADAAPARHPARRR